MILRPRKVVIIGAGHVGSHVGYSLATQGLAETIVYIDVDIEKAKAQATDIYDATVYLPQRVQVRAGNYDDLQDAHLLVVAAGPLPDMNKGQTRMDTLNQTVDVLEDIIDHINQTDFDGFIVSISNPADVVAHYLQTRLQYPAHKLISTSTTLDSARLRRAIADEIGIDQKSIYAYALGEHGESQMVPWSTVTIGGKPLLELMKEQPETYGDLDLEDIARRAKKTGWDILGGKGSTEFGIGATCAEVVRAIFADENKILPISVLLQGEYGVTDVYASVPTILGIDGVKGIIELNMTKEEEHQFHASCDTMKQNYNDVIRAIGK